MPEIKNRHPRQLNYDKGEKTKNFTFNSLGLITGLIIYSWISFLLTDMTPTWRHYSALVLFAVLVYLYFKSFAKTVMATGLYFLLATLNALSMTPERITGWSRFGTPLGSIETPHFQILSLMLLVLFLVLNFDTMIDIYLDYKEAKAQRKT